MKSNAKITMFYILAIALTITMISSILSGEPPEKIVYSDIIEHFQNEEVRKFEVDVTNNLILEIETLDKNGKLVTEEIRFRLRSVDIFREDTRELVEAQHKSGIIEYYDYEEPKVLPWWVSALPYLLIIGIVIAVWVYSMKQMTGGQGGGGVGRGGGFGKSRARLMTEDAKKVSFKDVAGADEEKEELEEVVEFLRSPSKFTKLGAKIPRGVLLVGPPGTGKTLLAKAVAGEAGVPFYSISGSDFVEMYVGVGASRVRDLFETAKRSAPCIIFIDEIDAVGRQRGAGLGGGHDEREQTLNQLLVEMDGFGSNDGIIVIAATNRPDILDSALLRPGRFDRQVTVNYPDIKGREEILKVHSRNKPFESNVDLVTVAKGTVGFTGADLANLLNEAALLAARKNKTLIGKPELEEALIKVVVGPKKKSKVISEKEKRLTAYHEAGHAIVTKISGSEDPVHQISIIPSGGAGGYTLSLPQEDRSYRSKTDMERQIIILLGGRVAEKLVLGDISTGASNDIKVATNYARNMVTKYGMSDKLGPILYANDHGSDEVFLGRDFSSGKNYSEEIAAQIDLEIREIISNAYAKATKILEENMDKLHFISEFLMKNELMDESQFAAAMDSDATIEDLENMSKAKMEESKRANEEKALENKKREEELAKLVHDIANAPLADDKKSSDTKKDDKK